MTQPEIARSIGTSVVMLVAGFAMLIAAVIAFTVHATTIGDVFLALMIACGVVSFAASVRSRNRARAFVRSRQEQQRGDLEDRFRKSLP
jgi:membrane protein implicated in regulation of membrane protease activity